MQLMVRFLSEENVFLHLEQKTNFLLFVHSDGQNFSSSFSPTVQLFESPDISRSLISNLCSAGARVPPLRTLKWVHVCVHSNPGPQPLQPRFRPLALSSLPWTQCFLFLFFFFPACQQIFLFLSLKLSYVFHCCFCCYSYPACLCICIRRSGFNELSLS